MRRTPAAAAVRLAVALRDRVWELAEGWSRLGFDLQLAAGVALGHATIGRIGFEQRWEYAPVGTVPTLAERLCESAAPGQILISRRVFAATESLAITQPRRRPGPPRLREARTGLGRPRRSLRGQTPQQFFWLYSAVRILRGLTPLAAASAAAASAPASAAAAAASAVAAATAVATAAEAERTSRRRWRRRRRSRRRSRCRRPRGAGTAVRSRSAIVSRMRCRSVDLQTVAVLEAGVRRRR